MVFGLCGAVPHIKKHAFSAVRCLCFNHALNLSLSKPSEVEAIRNTDGIIKEIIFLFTAFVKQNVILKKILGGQLKGLCETRWAERHDSAIHFQGSVGSVLKLFIPSRNGKRRKAQEKQRMPALPSVTANSQQQLFVWQTYTHKLFHRGVSFRQIILTSAQLGMRSQMLSASA